MGDMYGFGILRHEIVEEDTDEKEKAREDAADRADRADKADWLMEAMTDMLLEVTEDADDREGLRVMKASLELRKMNKRIMETYADPRKTLKSGQRAEALSALKTAIAVLKPFTTETE